MKTSSEIRSVILEILEDLFRNPCMYAQTALELENKLQIYFQILGLIDETSVGKPASKVRGGALSRYHSLARWHVEQTPDLHEDELLKLVCVDWKEIARNYGLPAEIWDVETVIKRATMFGNTD